MLTLSLNSEVTYTSYVTSEPQFFTCKMEIIILPYSIEAMTKYNVLKIKYVVRNQLVVVLPRRAYSKTLIHTAVLKFSFPINLYGIVSFLYLGFLVKIWQLGGSSPWFVPKKYLTRWPVSLELTRLSWKFNVCPWESHLTCLRLRPSSPAILCYNNKSWHL